MRLLFFFAFALTCSCPAFADSLVSTRGQGLVERSHHVEVSQQDGIAKLVVRRSFYNPGTQHEQAEIRLHLPRGAAATGLRIKAGDVWHDAELMEAEKAEKLYRELTGIGPHTPKDPALLSWVWADELALSIFPIAPKSTSFVEYTLTVPLSYEKGEFFLSYPRGPQSSSDEAKVLVAPTISFSHEMQVKVEGKSVTSRAKTTLADVKRHPLLDKYDFNSSFRYALLPIDVAFDFDGATVTVQADIEHTWSGDVALDLLSPDGIRHSIDPGDWMSNNKNLKHVEVTLPKTHATKGRWYLVAWDTYPELDSGQVRKWSLAFDTESIHEEVFFQTPTAVPNQQNTTMAQIRVAAPVFDVLDLSYARVAVLPKKHFVRQHLRVAKQISSLPKELLLSLVVDISHSMEEGEHLKSVYIFLQRLLRIVPNAEVDLILFARYPELFGDKRWNAKALMDVLENADVATRNGSHLDRALHFSESRAKDHAGVHQTIVFTDDRLRPTWNQKQQTRALKANMDAPLHVATFGRGHVFERADGDRLFSFAKRRGGVLMHIPDLQDERRSMIDKEALYFIRPTRIENVRFAGKGMDRAIEEGEEILHVDQVARSKKALRFEGQIWSRSISKRARSNRFRAKALAASIFPLDMYSDLNRKEMLKLAFFGEVVSPVTSYLAIEPGVRPSTVGLERFGTGGGGASHGAGGGIGFKRHQPDLASYLRPAIARCYPQLKRGAIVDLDLTSYEIVDVRLKHIRANADGISCLRESLWRVQLPSTAYWRPSASYRFRVHKMNDTWRLNQVR